MSELYAHFGKPIGPSLDFSDEALLSLYNHESYGAPLSPKNGYAVGKRYLNLQVTSWREAIRRGIIAKFELYEDPAYPHWWLDSVLKDMYVGMTYQSLMAECKKDYEFTRPTGAEPTPLVEVLSHHELPEPHEHCGSPGTIVTVGAPEVGCAEMAKRVQLELQSEIW